MPLSAFFLLVQLGVTYWSYKYLILFSVKPPKLNFSLITTIHRFLPFAIVLHSLVSILILGSGAIYQVRKRNISFLNKFKRCNVLSILLLVFVILMGCDFLRRWLVKIWKQYKNVDEFEDYGTYRQNRENIRTSELEDYQIINNPEFQYLRYLQKIDYQNLKRLKHKKFREILKEEEDREDEGYDMK